jgi:ABC-2 type transport system permease protein
LVRTWTQSIIRAFYIAKKDAKVYYFKAPNFTYGLLMPVSLFLAFFLAGESDSILMVAGLTSLAILFGTTSIEAVAVVLEKQTGTFEKLLAAPVSFFTILLGKALAGFFFGLVIATVILVPLTVVSGTAIASPMLAFLGIAFSSLAFSALGVLVSAYAKWVPEAQMLSNFLRFPMAFLSGAFVPLENMPFQLGVVARFLPLTYSVEALRISINDPANTLTYLFDIIVLALFSLALLVIAAKVLQRRIE